MKINILHISDLHLAKTPVRGDLLRFSALIETETYERIRTHETAASFNPLLVDAVSDFVDRYKNQLDAIIITGDISTTGNVEDLEETFDIINGNGIDKGFGKLTKNRNPVFNFPDDIPIFLLPGNHDRYNSDGWLPSPGSKNFHNIFKAFWREDVETFTLPRENISIGILCADFSLRDSNDSSINHDLLSRLYRAIGLTFTSPDQLVASLAQGKVYDGILEELISQTESFIQACNENKKEPFIIWAIHFPPNFPVTGTEINRYKNLIKDEYKKLIGENLLTSAASKLGVEVILAGHRHKPNFYQINGIDISCSGSTTQFMLDEGEILYNFCHIFTIDVSAGFKIYVNDFQFFKKGISDVGFKKVK